MPTKVGASPRDWKALRKKLGHRALEAVPWLVSILAIVAAKTLADKPVFQRISFVISDEISRGLGIGQAGDVVLIRIEQSFPKPVLETILAGAVQTLVRDYRASAVGVDIDFSGRGYDSLARKVACWSRDDPEGASRVVWGVGPVEPPGRHPPMSPKAAYCASCASCATGFVPKPVFGADSPQPPVYGIALAFPELDGTHRASLRFVCHRETEARLDAFHFKLVKVFCAQHPDLATCGDLRNSQAETTIYSWYQSEPVELCDLVHCEGPYLGARSSGDIGALEDKIALLYSDVPGNDEHMTMVSTRKGAEIVASLVENELHFGVDSHWLVELLKITLEAIITGLLLFIFHWKYTKSWAMLLAIPIFLLYLHFVPQLSRIAPDFRNYVFAIILAFWIEVMLKSAWNSVFEALKHWREHARAGAS